VRYTPRVRLIPIVLLLLAGCSETSTRTPDDAAGPDAGTADLHGGREAAWDLPTWDAQPLEGGAPDAGPSIWRPKPGTTWHWQLTKTVDQTVNATMFDIDLFDNTKTTIAALKAKGRVVICYFSAGSYESWRPDAKDFPQSVLGSKMSGWDELWLDIRSPAVHQIMKARMDLAVTKGCDGVEPDNVDGHDNATGFPLVPADQLAYNTLLAAEAHKRGLSVGLKNDLSQVAQLLPHFDWALNEQCLQYTECDLLAPFIQAGKAVFHVEYSPATRAAVCPMATALGFDSQIKKLELDAWFVACWN